MMMLYALKGERGCFTSYTLADLPSLHATTHSVECDARKAETAGDAYNIPAVR